MAQIGAHLVTGQIQESGISLSAWYGDQPDHFALCCMRNFGWNGLWMAQNGPLVLRECQKWCFGALAQMGFLAAFLTQDGAAP